MLASVGKTCFSPSTSCADDPKTNGFSEGSWTAVCIPILIWEGKLPIVDDLPDKLLLKHMMSGPCWTVLDYQRFDNLSAARLMDLKIEHLFATKCSLRAGDKKNTSYIWLVSPNLNTVKGTTSRQVPSCHLCCLAILPLVIGGVTTQLPGHRGFLGGGEHAKTASNTTYGFVQEWYNPYS